MCRLFSFLFLNLPLQIALATDAEIAPESVCGLGGSCSSLIQSVQNTSKVPAHKLQEQDQKLELLQDNAQSRLSVLTQVHEQLKSQWGATILFVLLAVLLILFLFTMIFAFFDNRNTKAANDRREARQPLSSSRPTMDRTASQGSRPVTHAPRPSSAPTSAISIPPSSYSTKGPAPNDLYLCGEELVVPDGSECNLVVPSLQDHSFAGGRVQMAITDTSGSSILRVEVLQSADRDGTRARLTSVGGDTVWASCKAGDSGGRKASLALHNKESRQAFAFMRMNPDKSFEVETVTGQVVRFDGALGSQLRAKDSNGVLLGVSDKSRAGYSLRVGPLVDVGFMVTSCVAMDLMLADARR